MDKRIISTKIVKKFNINGAEMSYKYGLFNNNSFFSIAVVEIDGKCAKNQWGSLTPTNVGAQKYIQNIWNKI